MDGSANPYLLQAGVIASGLYGMENKVDPGQPLNCNMYTDYKNYPDLNKLPNDLEDALDKLEENKIIKEAFGEEVINSYLKLKKQEIDEFNKDEVFDKRKDITNWERKNTLDC